MLGSDELGAYGKNFAELYDAIQSHRNLAREIDRLQEILSQSLAPDAAILDLGCGTGLHAIELASRGYKITGLDTSPDMIAVARGKKSDVAFVCGAIGEVHGIGPFDACISLYNVINCVEGLERLCEFFISVSSVLYPKARFICECWNPVAIIQSPPTRVVRKYDSQLGEITRSAVPTWDFMKQALQIDYDIEVVPRSRPGDVSKFSVSHPIRLFTPMEIEFALTRAGFEMVEVRTALPEFELAGANDRMLAVSALKI